MFICEILVILRVFKLSFFVQIMEPPWQAYNVLEKMDYPYEVSVISKFECNSILANAIIFVIDHTR